MRVIENDRLTPDAFRKEIDRRGWLMIDLADYFGISESQLHRIANDRRRPAYWDCAIAALPVITRAQRRALATNRIQARGKPAPKQKNAPTPKLGPGYTYHGALVPGSIVKALQDMGDSVQMGDDGQVYEVEDLGDGERYYIKFKSYEDWFTANEVAEYMIETGLDKPLSYVTGN